MQADDPPYLTVGTEVSAKYKGAFCEAKIRKVVRVVKCKVTFKAGNGNAQLTDDQIKGTLRVGATVEAKHPDKNQYLEATINKIQDSSQYTVVFDDGDITTLRRSALCLKSGRHFNESETLDQLPLTHPEHFSNPVVGGRRGVRRRAANNDADKEGSSEEEEEDTPTKKDGRKKYEKELDMGKVVCVESTDKKKSKDTWFPALVVSPAAQETYKIRVKDEYLVRSFRDGRYYTVPKKEISVFTKESSSKYDSNSNVLRTAVDKALQYLEKDELPPHWDREVLFGNARQSESGGEDQQSESEVSEDDPREEKDRFIAQLYKFMDDRSTPLNKVPQVCNKDLDLHKLFKTVTSKGGYTKVTNTSQWKAITIKMGFGNMPSTSTINLVKQAYKKFLFNFEEFYRKLGCTWTPRTAPTSSKSRSSRSLFRDRATPSSSRESVRESKKEDVSEETPSKKEVKEKSAPEEKAPSVERDSPTATVDTGTGSESDVKKSETEEPRRSRGRQSKKEVEEAAAASPTSSKKKRQPNASKERDSSVASSKDESGSAPPTPSSGTPSTKKVGRGKYKRQSTKGDTEEKETKKEEPVVPPPEPPAKVVEKIMEIRLGDKLQVYYPKSEGKTYEAKVIDINEKDENFLVHYTGWNNRYDEWIDRARVSENITLKMEAGGDSGDSSGKSANAASATQGPNLKGGAKRKGRNSSSATSTTSNSTTTSSAVTPSLASSGTRSKSATGKRKRSTSSEIPVISPVPKRRRTRQKSGQETTSTAAASESEPESSDSDGKSHKSEKNSTNASALMELMDRPSTPETVASTKTVAAATNETKPPSLKDKKEVKVDKKPELVDIDDEMSSSSVASSKSKEKEAASSALSMPTGKAEEGKESSSGSSSGGGSNQVIDLNQIRSEMKGLEKMVKSGGLASTSSVSSPVDAPPSLSAVGGSPTSQEPTKVDIYEFQDDVSDDSAATSAPKLKMFSPRSPDKGPSTSTTPESTRKEDISPVVLIEKMQMDKHIKVEQPNESSKTVASAAPETLKETVKIATTSSKAIPPATPKLSAPVVSSIPPLVSTTPPSTPPVVQIVQTTSTPATSVITSTVSASTPIPPSTTTALSSSYPTASLMAVSTSPIVIKTSRSAPPPRMPSPAPSVLRASPPVVSSSIAASVPPPALLVSNSVPPPPPVVFTTAAVTISAAPTPVVARTPSPIVSHPPPPPVLLQRPQLQPVLTPVRPVITITSTSSVLPPERPVLHSSGTLTPVAATVSTNMPGSLKDTKLLPFMARKQELFPHLIQQGPDTSAASVPTISIISAKDVGDIQTQPPPPPIKVAATIPPPPLPVGMKTPVKSSPFASGTESPSGVKQKKKKAKLPSSTTTPVKSMAPLPLCGAPPPPPFVGSSGTPLVTQPSTTPTPGRKTPVKKRIPPPMDSPGKPGKPFNMPFSKPGKMNPEAMNAAIANVGASPQQQQQTTPAVVSVPTTVITSTSSIFQTHPSAPGVLFATSSSQALKATLPVTIKSSAESIAASIAAVASMGSTTKSVLSSAPDKKSGMPMKRFMKDSISEKLPSKDRFFPVGTIPTSQPQQQQSQLHISQPPPPPIVIGKSLESSQPPITIQAKFQTAGTHTIPGTTITGPAVTFVKTSSGHHILDQGQHHQSNLPKHPVIIIPAAPVVIKPAPYQHHPPPQPMQQQQPQQHHHHHGQASMQPVIVSKPVQVDLTSQHQQSLGLLSTAASSAVRAPMLPITVTPSVVSSVPVTMTLQANPVTSSLDVRPTTSDYPPSITVTKATTVMKSISPDIVSVTSYSNSRTSSGFTPVKQEPVMQAVKMEERKKPEIIVKPAPASAQIVFQMESKNIDVISTSTSITASKDMGQKQGSGPESALRAAAAEEESCNSLLCEEIIPGSPTTGEDSEKFEEEVEQKGSCSKEPELEQATRSTIPGATGNKPVIIVGPKFEDEEGFLLDLDNRRHSRFGDDDDEKTDERSVDSPMGPPSEGRMDLPFRDSFSGSNVGDHSAPSSPSTSSTISTDDDDSRQHDTSRMSPTPEGGSSKSKDSDDDDMDSDVGSKSTHIDDGDSKHGSTRGSTRIRNKSSRLGRSPSPPLGKRRRTMRRNKSPEEVSRYGQRSRTSSGRRITPVGSLNENKEAKPQPPPPSVNLAKPPKTGRYNFIPNLIEVLDPDERISMISQAINDLKDQYHKTKTEAASFDRRVKRWKRRVREKERLARQEATRAAS